MGFVGPIPLDSPFNLVNENVHGLFSNITLLSMLLSSLVKKDFFFAKPNIKFKEEYDYIVVGGGSAGNVMASRLSEKPCVSVLLIEAGGEPPILTEVPAYARAFLNSHIDWAFKTTPQKFSGFGLKQNQVILNNGRVLGGGSSLNAMLYVRGNRRNYDQWAAEGATGWSYNDVLPYFLKLEDNRNMQEVDPEYHTTGGPITVEKINYTPEIKLPVLKAANALGYETLDVNGRRQTGMFNLQATVRNQTRCSTTKAYLNPARNRTNLDILTNAYARKVLIHEINGTQRAYGVEFDFEGQTHTVRATKEVVLSAGAIKTPQLLMLSGIGPRKHLEKFNIKVNVDLPGVGQNFHDHVSSHLIYKVNKTITPVVEKIILPSNVLDYIHFRRGPLCSSCTVMAFLNGVNTSRGSIDFPMQQLHISEYQTLDSIVHFNLKPEVLRKVYLRYAMRPVYICFTSNLQPYSRGEITLNSTDPHDDPIINPNYLQDERDVRNIVEGLKECNAIARHPAMKQVQAKLIETMASGYPGCEQFEGNEDAYLGCIGRSVPMTYWHYAGTARMGSRDDSRSVVDPELRVIGVDGLRVVCAAIFPIVPSGNTNIPTIMVAEKAYDMMKNDVMCEGEFQVPKTN